jgi:hypothetical protein
MLATLQELIKQSYLATKTSMAKIVKSGRRLAREQVEEDSPATQLKG